jgi:protein involved in polysaccharide export with SLBB domain
VKTRWKIPVPSFLWLGLLLIVALLGGGCQTATKQYTFSPLPVDFFETNKAGPTIEQAMVGDVVIVKFTFEFSPPLEERIREDGTITLPFIGAIKASGKTADELAMEIKNRYVPEYYKRMGVAVAIARGVYYVGGQVQRPGQYNYLGPITVTKAIESAGGFTEFAARRRVRLDRTNGKAYLVDCKKAAQEASLDRPVYPGDKIVVPMIQ